MTIEQQLEAFRIQWEGVRVEVYDIYMVYKVVAGYARLAADRANKLINVLNLSLVAEPTESNSFIVKQRK